MTETERLRASRWSTVVLLLLVGIFVVRLSSEGQLVLPPQPAGAESAVSDADRDADSVPMPRPAGTAARAAPPAGLHRDPDPYPLGTRRRAHDARVAGPGGLDRRAAARQTGSGGPLPGSVTPGEQGTSVIVGHVDTGRGPAVFYDLGRLAKNSRVEVARADGTTAVFTVYGVKGFTKRGFPAASVYRPTGAPELRLITCGGAFSEKTGYQGNVVAFARLTETRKAA